MKDDVEFVDETASLRMREWLVGESAAGLVKVQDGRKSE
jgi:hypothetical protein